MPVNVMACKQMLVLCGETYPSRLWCAWELFTLFSFQGHKRALAKVELLPLLKDRSQHSKMERMLKSAKETARESEDNVLNNLLSFDVQRSHCYDPNEESNLRSVIIAVGAERFNESIRKLAKEVIQAREKAGERERAGRHLTGTHAVTFVSSMSPTLSQTARRR